jgi:hypothetical protein
MKKIWIAVGIILLISLAGFALLTTQQQETASSLALSTVAPPLMSTPVEEVEAVVVDQTEEEVPTPTIEPVLPPGIVAGVVLNDEGPVQDAVVRVRATENKTLTAADGSFSLTVLDETDPISITAWVDGYYGGAETIAPGLVPITITLKRYHTTDNVHYKFASAEKCAECHPNYAEWQADAHSQSSVNPRFLTMYTGKDVHGNEPVVKRNSSGLPLPPEPGDVYYGPGFKVDFPDRTGNCAACHTPMAASLETTNTCGWSGCHSEITSSFSDQVPPGVSPTNLYEVAAEGINCDFCHKIGEVVLDSETQLPYAAKPGISSMKIYRPPEGEDIFFGTFDDAPGQDSYLPLQEESAFCAPCHYGVFDGVVGSHEVTGGIEIYNSYGEWLNSPYSDPETGQSCQDCHMPVGVDYDFIVYPEQGGFRRDPGKINNHQMPGAADEALLKNAVMMTTTATADDDQIMVSVNITNDKTGHHIPTGAPLRQMILLVGARDADRNVLSLQAGPVLPEWTGDFSGQPGQYYAKILEDEWTGEIPTAAFWRDIRLVEDTRIPALATDTREFVFETTGQGPVTIETQLIFRRAFQDLMEQKGWNDPDIVMAEETLIINVP